jgi:excisionase family DNA binding protein
MVDRLAHSVSEAAELLALGRTKTWELVHTGELGSVRVGRRVVVPLSAIEDYLDRRLAGTDE